MQRSGRRSQKERRRGHIGGMGIQGSRPTGLNENSPVEKKPLITQLHNNHVFSIVYTNVDSLFNKKTRIKMLYRLIKK